MSMVLNQGTKPEGVKVKTWNASTLHIHSRAAFDEIPVKEFLDQAFDLLAEQNLASDDARKVFLGAVRYLVEVDGWNAGGKEI